MGWFQPKAHVGLWAHQGLLYIYVYIFVSVLLESQEGKGRRKAEHRWLFLKKTWMLLASGHGGDVKGQDQTVAVQHHRTDHPRSWCKQGFSSLGDPINQVLGQRLGSGTLGSATAFGSLSLSAGLVCGFWGLAWQCFWPDVISSLPSPPGFL